MKAAVNAFTSQLCWKSKKYIPPLITLYFIEMEQSIAVGSANFSTGGSNYEPQIENWTDDTKSTYDIDF